MIGYFLKIKSWSCVQIYPLLCWFTDTNGWSTFCIGEVCTFDQNLSMDDTNYRSEEPYEIPYGEANAFFDSAPPLKDEEEIIRKIKDFTGKNSSMSGKLTSTMWITLMTFYFFSWFLIGSFGNLFL